MIKVQLTTARPIAEEIDVVSCLVLDPATQHRESLACETRATERNQSAAAYMRYHLWKELYAAIPA